MNVAFDPWIPVVTKAGEKRLVSLCDAFTNGDQYADLAVRPHERVSLMRLFICVAHAALDGPKDLDEWDAVPGRLPEAARQYLEKWKDSFELFHPEKPWLQVVEISKAKDVKAVLNDVSDWTSTSKLNFSLATGNNTTLYDHGGMRDSREISLEHTILSMLTFQCFSPGGLISQVFWKGIQSAKSSKDGPCVPASMVHSLLRGDSLARSIHLNLPTYEDAGTIYATETLGRPVWERMPEGFSDVERVENATKTYIGRLVPMSRLIRLHPTGKFMLLGDGLPYPPFTDGFPAEPTSSVIIRTKNKTEERALLSYRPSKALWRELPALMVKRKSDGLGGPLSLRAIQDSEGCDLTVSALARDQATIVDTAESVFHIPAQLRSGEGVAAYEREVGVAESHAKRLGWAIESYRIDIDGGWEGRIKSAGPKSGALKARLYSIGTTHYWTTIEKNLAFLFGVIDAIGTDDAQTALETWRKLVFRAACDAYRVACGQETPRQIRAFAKGWKKLVSIKRDDTNTSPDDKEEENELAS